jgi:hypothetical protein
MLITILILLAVSVLCNAYAVYYLSKMIKTSENQVKGEVDFARADTIKAVVKIIRRDKDMPVPDAEVISDELILRREIERYEREKKMLG